MKLWVIAAFVTVSLLISVYSLEPSTHEAFPSLALFSPHLYYIPIVLMTIWYPHRTLLLSVLIMAIYILFTFYFMMSGAAIDFISSAFTAAMYLWVVAATSMALRDSRFGPPPAAIDESAYGLQGDTAVVSGSGIKEQQIVRKSREYICGIINAFRSPNSQERARAMQTLNTIGEPAVEPLIDTLNDACSSTRDAAARTLGIIGDIRGIEPLIAALKDEDRRVREAASQALASIGRPARPRLLDNLWDEDWHVRMGAVIALRIIGGDDLVPEFVRLLRDESPYVRGESAKSLGRLANGGVTHQLLEALHDHAKYVRIRAAGSLGRLRDPAAVPALEQVLMEDPEDDVRQRAAVALLQIGTERGKDAVLRAASSADPRTRRAAQDSLHPGPGTRSPGGCT
ncbi:MAG: HEAT repeat domain-containing protein [Methanomicrobiaceae archaeon]|nr:HEAT repeat domain-containing protein [Methanomicrobiaceae archaeon]